MATFKKQVKMEGQKRSFYNGNYLIRIYTTFKADMFVTSKTDNKPNVNR